MNINIVYTVLIVSTLFVVNAQNDAKPKTTSSSDMVNPGSPDGTMPMGIVRMLPRLMNSTNLTNMNMSLMDDGIQKFLKSSVSQEILKSLNFTEMFGSTGEIMQELLNMLKGPGVPDLSKGCQDDFKLLMEPLGNISTINTGLLIKILKTPLGKSKLYDFCKNLYLRCLTGFCMRF